jgi:hypothetical protein
VDDKHGRLKPRHGPANVGESTPLGLPRASAALTRNSVFKKPAAGHMKTGGGASALRKAT